MKFDLAVYQKIESQYLESQLQTVQSKKIEKLKMLQNNLSAEKVLLEKEFEDAVDLYVGNRNPEVIQQLNEVDLSLMEAKLKFEFQNIFGVELNVDEQFENRICELSAILDKRVCETNAAYPSLIAYEEKITKYKRGEKILNEISRLKHLRDLEYLIANK